MSIQNKIMRFKKEQKHFKLHIIARELDGAIKRIETEVEGLRWFLKHDKNNLSMIISSCNVMKQHFAYLVDEHRRAKEIFIKLSKGQLSGDAAISMLYRISEEMKTARMLIA